MVRAYDLARYGRGVCEMRWNWLAATVAIVGAVALAVMGIEGWGWFLLIAIMVVA